VKMGPLVLRGGGGGEESNSGDLGACSCPMMRTTLPGELAAATYVR
jgi:hypothetical protein